MLVLGVFVLALNLKKDLRCSLYVDGVKTFRAFFRFERDGVTLSEFIELNAYKRVRVKENVFRSVLRSDETETCFFKRVYYTFHGLFSLCY